VARESAGKYLLVSARPNGAVTQHYTFLCNPDGTASSAGYSLDASVPGGLVWNLTINGVPGRQVWTLRDDMLARESAKYDAASGTWSPEGIEQPEQLARRPLSEFAAILERAGLDRMVSIDPSWGALAQLAGGIWHSPGQLVSYRWLEPDKMLEETQLLTQDKRVFTLNPDRSIRMDVRPSALNTQYKPYTVTLKANDKGDLTGSATIDYTFENDFVTTFQIARRKDKLSSRELFAGSGTPWNTVARLNAEDIAKAASFYQTAGQPDEIRRNWGLLPG